MEEGKDGRQVSDQVDRHREAAIEVKIFHKNNFLYCEIKYIKIQIN
jgi:hypothetical protein